MNRKVLLITLLGISSILGSRFYTQAQVMQPGQEIILLDKIRKLYKHKQYDSVLHLIDLKGKHITSDSGKFRIYYYIGNIERQFGNADHAIKAFNVSLSLAHKMNDLLEQANVHDKIGSCYRKRGQFYLAQKEYLQAKDLKESMPQKTAGSINSRAKSYNYLGIVFHELLKDSVAVDYYNMSLDLYGQLNNTRWIASLQTNRGLSYIQWATEINRKPFLFSPKDIKKREVLLDTGIFLLKKSLDSKLALDFSTVSISRTIQNLGYGYLEKENFDSALYYTRRSLAIRKPNGSIGELAYTFNNLGRTFDMLGKRDSAYYYYMLSQDNAQLLWQTSQAQSTTLLITLHSNLSKHYALRNDYKNAYLNLLSYDSLNWMKFNRQSINQIQELHTLYETEKKEAENKHLKETNLIEKDRNTQLAITLIISVLLTMAVLGIFLQRQKITKVIAQKNEESHRQEINQLIKDHELKSLEAMMTGQEEERKRIAEDLHDRLGSTLSAAKMQIEVLGENLNLDKNKPYATTTSLIDRAVEDTRQIAHNMLSGVLTKFGLLAALDDLKEIIESANKLNIEIKTENFNERLDGEVELNIYRIIQELISNILKHAKASLVSIEFKRLSGNLSVAVIDNGVGFNTKNRREGMGLKNLESRVNKLKGKWTIDSKPGNGTKIEIELPI